MTGRRVSPVIARSGADFAGSPRTIPRRVSITWWRVRSRQIRGRAGRRAIARVVVSTSSRYLVLAAGAVSGAGLAAAVLRYDGTDPINVLVVFGLLVALPFAFLLLSLLLPLWSSASIGGETNLGHVVLAVAHARRHPDLDSPVLGAAL